MTYTSPVCKGDILLGSACGKCERCEELSSTLMKTYEKFYEAKTMPELLTVSCFLKIEALEKELEALTLRVNYLADAVYGRQAVAYTSGINVTSSSLHAHPSVTCFPDHSTTKHLKDFLDQLPKGV